MEVGIGLAGCFFAAAFPCALMLAMATLRRARVARYRVRWRHAGLRHLGMRMDNRALVAKMRAERLVRVKALCKAACA